MELSSFTRNGTEIENDGFVKGNLNDSIQSPLGPIVVIPSAAYSDKTVSTIYVTRQSLSAASAGCSARLNISQNDEKSNIITLSFQDVSTPVSYTHLKRSQPPNIRPMKWQTSAICRDRGKTNPVW